MNGPPLPIKSVATRGWKSLLETGLLACLGFGLIAVLAGPAVAQDYSKADLEAFKKHLSAATSAFDDGRYDDSLQSLGKARELIDHPRIAYRLGRVYAKMNRCDDARQAYEDFLENDVSPAQRKKAESRLAELDDRCGAKGALSVECRPSGARLTVGEQQVLCPAKLTLDPGEYTAVVRANGYKSRAVSVSLSAGAELKKTVELERDPNAKRADATQAAFEEHMQQAHRAFEAKRFEEALKAYKEAEKLLQRPHVTYQKALTYEKLHRCADAERAYSEFLSATSVDEALLERARRRLGSIDERCSTKGTLAIMCFPEEAQLEVDGRPIECPGSLEMEAGSYRLVATADGHRSASVSVSIDAGETTQKEIMLDRLSDGETATPQATTDRGGFGRIAPWIVAGVGAGTLGAGVASDLSTARRAEQLQSAARRGDAARVAELQDRADAAKTRSIVLYASGSALLVGGIIWALATRPNKANQTSASKRSPATLTVRPSASGLQVRW